MVVLLLDRAKILGRLQRQLFAMQIGAMGDFCCYKMPVNVCEIILWLWRGEVFHNF